MKNVFLVSTESNVQTEMIVDVLNQNNIISVVQGKQAGEALEAYMGFSPYGDDIYVDKEDLAPALEVISGMEDKK
ncbi:MAG: DUF2007 domain-containing protein [Christensenella sp.]|uniref:putative signal transducing protein n=1 Tax=Christensenella sp. TaxID=1935934 RepID=UPI002B20406A|nr:DUF2007 domain-containing protein [Christensenella sp.]MEA5002171.1 DUF2007 domain-containing protein [Christensenella sp.]